MTDSSSTPIINNIGQGAEGVVGYIVSGNTINQEIKITPDAIKLNTFQTRSPYKALQRFDVDDSEYFFGRDQLTKEMRVALETSNLILVLGASGSGKSSVVRAKLIPEFLSTSSNRHNFVLTPKDDPFQSLYESLIGRDKVGPDKDHRLSESEAEFVLEGKPNGKPNVLAQVVQRLKDKDKHKNSEWLIFIDQFEELFTRCTNLEQRRNFIKSITQIAKSKDQSVKIVLAMRADFLEQFSPYKEFGKIVQGQIHLVTDMPEDELELAIKGPAAKHGVRFEPGLAKEIIADVQGHAGSLPLMQYTLDRLWEYEFNLDGLTDRTLNTQNYRVLGKVRGALEKHVNEIYGDLGEAGQRAAKRIFLSLVKVFTTDGIEKRVSQSVSRSELQGKAVPETIDRLINEKLLVSSAGDLSQAALTQNDQSLKQQAEIEIAHEILLTSWDKLQEWIQEAQDILQIRSRLREDMQRWQEHEQSNQELLKGSVLERILELKETGLFEGRSLPLSAAEEEYIAASQKFKKRELNRARWVAVGASIGVVLMAVQVRKTEIGQIQTSVALSEAKLANRQSLDAVVEAIRAGKTLKKSFFQLIFPDPQLKNQIAQVLQQGLYKDSVIEVDRLQGNGEPLDWGVDGQISWSSDGQTLAFASGDKTVKLWQPQLPQQEGTNPKILSGYETPVLGVSWSPNGQTLATVSRDGMVQPWQPGGDPLKPFSVGQVGQCYGISWSPDSELLAVPCLGATVQVLKRDGTSPLSLRDPEKVGQGVFSASWHPNGQILASGGADGYVRLWKQDGTLIKTSEKYENWVIGVSWNPEEQILATAAAGKIRLLKTDLTERTAVEAKGVGFVSWTADGQTLATAGGEDGTVRLWQWNGTKYLLAPLTTLYSPTPIANLKWSPDGQTLATLNRSDGTVRLWKKNPLLIALNNHGQGVKDVSFSRDGQILATAGADGTVKLLKPDGTLLRSLEGFNREVQRVSWSPDGQVLAAADSDTVKLWTRDGTPLKTLPGQGNSVYGVNWSPDGQTLASTAGDGTVKLWTRDGRLLKTPLHITDGDWGYDVSWSSDGKLLAVAYKNGKVFLLQQDGTVIKQLETAHNRASWSPNGKILATSGGIGSNKVRLWNPDGSLIKAIPAGSDGVDRIFWSPDGQILAVASRNTIKLWTLEGTLLATLEGHTDTVNSVTWSPDGKTLVSASQDQTVRLWQLSEYLGNDRLLDDLLAKGCDWVRDYLKHSPNASDRHLCDGVRS